jgi:hypothetical protein
MEKAAGRRPLVGAAAVIGAAGLCALAAWEGTLSRQSAAAHWSVGAGIAAALALAVVAGRGRQAAASRRWLTHAVRAVGGRWPRPGYATGIAVWVVLILAVIGWDLNSFAHQARDLPTLSYEFGRVTRWHWGRALVFAGWAALGVLLAAGRLRARWPPAGTDGAGGAGGAGGTDGAGGAAAP